MELLGLLTGLLSTVADLVLRRRRVQVLVHRGTFLTNASPPVTGASVAADDSALGGDRSQEPEQVFVKVINRSRVDVEITHIWFATVPEMPLLNNVRALPARLRPDETYEAWIQLAALPQLHEIEKLVRVRTSSGRTFKSDPGKDVPPYGFVAGGGSR